jgi:hypothetical protein
MDTHPPPTDTDAMLAAIEAIGKLVIDQGEAIVAAFRVAAASAFPPQCIDADGNLCDNWLDILADPLDPPRG